MSELWWLVKFGMLGTKVSLKVVVDHSKAFSLTKLKVWSFPLKFHLLVFHIQIGVLNLWFAYTLFSFGFSLLVYGCVDSW